MENKDLTVPAEHYRVHVNYVLPDFRLLNGTLFNWASNLWDGREWENHPKCPEDLDLTPRELTFFLKHFRKDMTDAQVMKWAETNGYRAANHLEALAFAMANPELQKQVYYVALGSFAVLDDGFEHVAALYSNGAERELSVGGLCLDDSGRDKRVRYLLVRERKQTKVSHAMSEHTIDCSERFNLWGTYTYLDPNDQIKSRVRGKFTLELDKLELFKAEPGISGNDLKKVLEGKRVLPVHIIEFLLRRPPDIPDSWKGKRIFCWGTIYHTRSGFLTVPYLYWRRDSGSYEAFGQDCPVSDHWSSETQWLNQRWGPNDLALLAP